MKAVPNLALGLKTSIRSLVPPISPLAMVLIIFGILHAGMVEKAWGDLLFARTDYDAAGARFVTSGDLDRDGDLDLAVAGFSGVVSIYLNNGDGTFQARRDYTAGAQLSAVAIADLNRDGILDLAVANGGSNTVSIMPGNGDGSFGTKVDLGTGMTPTCVATGDLDGDGYPDLAVTNSADNTVSVLLSNSAGGFDVKTDFATGSNPQSVAISDVNGDGRPDLVIKNLTNSVSVLLGNGNGTFQSKADYPSGPGPGSAAVADLNGDGILDLAVSGSQRDNQGVIFGTISVLMGVGDGTFRPGQVLSDYGPYSNVAAGDLDGDGVPDLVVPRTDGSSIGVFLGIGDGTFQAQRSYVTPDGPESVAIADLNGDGRLDLAVATASDHILTVLLNIPDHPPTLNTISNTTVNEGVTADQTLAATDVDGQALAFSLASGPSFASVTTISPTTGNLHLAPGFTDGNGNPSTYAASVSVSDGSLTDSKPLTITVTNVDRAPVLAAVANQTVAEGATADVGVTATDADGDVIALSATLPSFAILTSVPAAGTVNGSIHIAPNFGDAAGSPYTATVVASSGSPVLMGTQNFMIAVIHVNRSPSLAQPSGVAVNEGMSVDQTLNATDPDGDALTFSLASGPSFASVATNSPGTGVATGTIHVAPGFSDGNGNPSTYAATVTASDGSLADSKPLTISVNNTNRPPIVSAPLSVSTFEGSPVSFPVSATDPDGDPVVLAVLNQPVGTTFIDNGGGSGSFNWTPGFNQAGTYSVSFIARDNQGAISAPGTVTITVNDLNRPPTSNAGGPYSGVVSVPITFNGTGSSDPDGSPLTYSWNFGDGTQGVGVTPQHAYATGGTFIVVLTVSDGLLSSSASSIATIQDTFQARAFTTNGYGTIRLGSGKSSWCVQIEPVGGSYLITSVLEPTITMKYGTNQILAIAGKASIGADKDGNGIQELTACFSKADLRTLFSGLPKGTNTVSVTLEGDLSTGGKFRATLTVDVVGTGGGVAATVSPNPLNPGATLSFTTSGLGQVRVCVYGLDGRLVRTLLDGAFLGAGRHDVRIDGRSDAGTRMASGIYFYRIEAPEGPATGQFAVMK